MSKLLIITGAASSMLKFRRQFLMSLVASGHDVTVATPIEETHHIKQLKHLGVSVAPLPLSRTGLNPWADLLTIFKLRHIIGNVAPDQILAYAHKPVLYGLLVKGSASFFGILTGLGYVFTGEDLKRKIIRAFFRLIYPLLLRRASALIFLNPDDAGVFQSKGMTAKNLRVETIPGEGVDPQRFSEVPQPDGRTKFLMLARLLKDKGLREYAEAAAKIKKQYPEAEFHLAGPADSNPAAISLNDVKAWEREGVLTYHGEVSDVRPLIAACSVYVLPSYREGMPISVLEAMSSGRAVLATDVPGCRSAVKDGETGLLVPARDASALASAMLRFVENPSLAERMGAAGRRRVEREFSLSVVNRRLFEILGLS